MKKLYYLLPLMLLVMAACSEGEKSYEEKMAEEHAGDKPVANEAWYEPDAPVDTQTVSYAKVNGNEINGYLAQPQDAPDDLPGIIVIHEWWGLNDNIKMMTRRLAAEGYSALAVDLYNGRVAETPENARSYMSDAMQDMGAATDNLKAAYQYLSDQHNAAEVGTIGWCFGGGMSLNTALALTSEIDATVIYYGRLVTDASQLELLEMPVLGIFGAEDQGIPVSSVREFETTLDSLGKENQIYVYDGANHAFANPSGQRYQAEAAADAWSKTTAFLNYYLKDEGMME